MANTTPSAGDELLDVFSAVIIDAKMTVMAREESPYFGDVAITLRSGDLEIRLVSDQGIYFAELRPLGAGAEWFDLSLLQMLLTGVNTLDGVPIESQASFLRERLADVGRALAPDRWPVTRLQLQELERRRVATRFGSPPERR